MDWITYFLITKYVSTFFFVASRRIMQLFFIGYLKVKLYVLLGVFLYVIFLLLWIFVFFYGNWKCYLERLNDYILMQFLWNNWTDRLDIKLVCRLASPNPSPISTLSQLNTLRNAPQIWCTQHFSSIPTFSVAFVH